MSYLSTILLDSPVSAWLLNETTGTVAADSAGSNTGTYTGAVTLNQATTLGGIPVGISLPGANTAYVVLKTGALLCTLTNASVEVWFNIASTSSIAGSSAPLYCERAATGNDIWKLEILKSNGKLLFTHRDDAGTLNQPTGGSNVCDGAWHQVVLVKSGTGITVYVDGASSFTGSLTGTNTFTNAGLETWLGGDKGDNTISYNGLLTATSIYNTALTATQVVTHYIAGFGFSAGFTCFPSKPRSRRQSLIPSVIGWTNGLQAAHLFLDSIATNAALVVPDLSGNGNNGTLDSTFPYNTGPWGFQAVGSGLGVGKIAVAGADLQTRTAFTVVILAQSTVFGGGSVSGIRVLCGQGNGSTMQAFYDGKVGLTLQVNSFGFGASGRLGNVTGWHVYGFRFNGATTTLDVWVDGNKVGTGTGPSSISSSGSGYAVLNNGGLSDTWIGPIAAHWLWYRALGDKEMALIGQDAFAPARPAPSRLSVLAGATAPPPATGSPFLLAHF